MSSIPADIVAAARSISVEPRALAALVAVESSGKGFGPDGRPTIRCEAHVLWTLTSGAERALVDAHFHVYGPRPWEGHAFSPAPVASWPAVQPSWSGYHGSHVREWAAFTCASSIAPDAAVRATSWGLGQVLGTWRDLGFDSAFAFAVAQSTRAGQLDTMARWLRLHRLVEAVNGHDWSTVERTYNGGGQHGRYAERLAAEYAALG